MATILSETSGKQIKCNVLNPEDLQSMIEQIPSISAKAYMESANITMQLAKEGKMKAQTIVKDDVLTVLGRPGLTMAEWAKTNLS